MAINTIGDMAHTFKNYKAGDWAKTTELGSHFNIPNNNLAGLEADGSAPLSFGELLTQSISKVNQMQHESNIAVEKLASGKSQNLHETLLAVEKAEIAFKMMNQVRSKVIGAYQEIMKMQV